VVIRAQRTHWWNRSALMLVMALVVLAVVPVVVYGLTRDRASSAPAGGVAARSSADPKAAATPASTVDDPGDRTAQERRLALYFGDSYFVSDFNYTHKSNTMAKLSGRRLGYEKILVRGGGGTGFVQANWDYGLPPYLGQIDQGALKANNPDLVVIEGGSNDLHQPKWKVRRNAGKVLDRAREMHRGALLVLVGPLDADPDFSDTIPLNNALRKVAAAHGVPYIDDMRWLEGHPEMVGPDGVHPTAHGHRMLGRKLAKALAAVGA